MKKFIIPIVFCLAITCGCDDMQLQEPVELGAVPEIVLAATSGGEIQIPFYANLSGTIRMLDEVGWASMDATTFSSDGTLKVNVTANSGIRRYTRIVFSANDAVRRDTVVIRQEGIIDTLSIRSSSVIVYNKMGDTYIPASLTLPASAVKATVRYLDQDASDWVKACSVREDAIVVRTEDNTSAKQVRNAVLTLSWTNGWGQKMQRDINLTQATSAASGNHVGTPATFEEVRAMASAEPVVIGENLYLEGYIVSDNASKNVTENPRRTSTSIDYTVTDKSAVFESLDGKYGFLLETISEEDNVFEPFSKVILLLSGAQLRKYPSPDRYVISNIRSSMVASTVAVGENGIPSKTMHISALKDSDIYTRVTLADCEFPIRKGGLTPLNEGYTSAYKADRVTKFASLLRDKEGSSIYLFTNTSCPYRRDGRKIGNGSGPVSGIVVSESYESFQTVGRLQLRHQRWEDLGFADDFANGFSSLLCEWRYLRQGNSDHSWNATAGTGTMTHTCQIGSYNSTYNTWCYPAYDQSYLGPVFNGCTNVNGFGVTLEDGSDYGSSYTGSVDKGQLLASAGLPMAWMREMWINNSGEFYSWEIHFSTKNISTDFLSLQISTLNASQEGKSPVNWKVEWAQSKDSGTQWNEIATYTVPDIVLWSMTQPWQSAGYKPIDIPLPLDMLGKDDVYIRLTPANTAGNTPQGYCDTKFVNGSAGSTSKANNALNYVAIRFNK
ncbi:MAG: BACON domain-containing protein [Bacteroidales bacterium]|nr:BACON domain-containing protein [Bacteroidales bacterium]